MMYTTKPTMVEKRNRLGKVVGQRQAHSIVDREFVLATVAREEDAIWLAQVINLVLLRDQALRQQAQWDYRLQAWLIKLWPFKKKVENTGPLPPLPEIQNANPK